MTLIKDYPLDYILKTVSHEYDLGQVIIKASSSGLDNSVYFLIPPDSSKPQYVLKIVETKSDQQIISSIETSKKIGQPFCNIIYIPNNSHNLLTVLPEFDKRCFLYRYIDGKKPDLSNPESIEKFADFMANFHEHKRFPTSQENLDPFINDEFNHLEEYWNFRIREGLNRHFPERLRFYKSAMDYVTTNKARIIFSMKELPALFGVVHGDMNGDNVLEDDSGSLSCIDFDGVKEKSLQMIDLLQAISKSEIIEDNNNFMLFLKKYYQKRGVEIPNHEKLQESVATWILIFSLKSMLSTDYYTFCIPKLTPEWNKKNATDVLDRLERTIKKTHPIIAISTQARSSDTLISKAR